MNNDTIESVECIWVDIWCMLDWIIGLCHKMAEMHLPGMGCSTSETLLWLTETDCAKIRTHCKAEHQKVQYGEMGACVLKAKPKMDANEVPQTKFSDHRR